MAYRVIIMPPAKRRLDMYVGYTAVVLRNKEAAINILKDARISKERLSKLADVMKLCDDPVLSKYGYRKLRFQKHDFFMIYRIDGNNVIVDGMFHELQDYESIFKNEMGLT